MVRYGILVPGVVKEGWPVPFGVIHQDIFDSTLARNYEARWLFQDLIILADENDNVMMDVVDIAHRIRVPHDQVLVGLEFLMAEDPLSKSTLERGRRITPIKNGEVVIGYHVVNRHYYKRLMSRVRRREYMRRYRAKKMEEGRL